MTARAAPNSSTGSPIVKLAGVGIVLLGLHALWSANATVMARIAELPVQGKAATAAPATPAAGAPAAETPSLAPLLIESQSRAQARQANAPALGQSAATFTTLFGTQPDAAAKEAAKGSEKGADKGAAQGLPPSPALPDSAAAVPPPPPVDHFAELAGVVRLDAVAPDGAVLNGVFYAVGAELTPYAYPDKAGKTVAPKLQSAQGHEALITEPGGRRRLRLKLSSTN